MKKINFAIVYGTLFAVLQITFRLIINFQNPDLFKSYPFVFSGFVYESFFGFIFGYIAFHLRTKLAQLFYILFILTPVLTISLISYHYEARFGRFISMDQFYYINELDSLIASISVFSFIVFFLQLIVMHIFLFISQMVARYKTSSINNKILLNSYLFAILLITTAGILDSRYFSTFHIKDNSQPILWLAKSELLKFRDKRNKVLIKKQDFLKFLYLHGHEIDLHDLNLNYPLCDKKEGTTELAQGYRNVILLILESVGKKEVNTNINGIPLMLNLREIAKKNISFENIFSPGTKSAQSLPAIFSGLPAHPYNHYLWSQSEITLNGFPSDLKNIGYETVYFHGSDLSFEGQRGYLKNTGFNKIIEYDIEAPYKSYGWGYDDATMLEKLKDNIIDLREKDPDKPFFLSLYTIGTHDPFILPENWKPLFNDRYGENIDCCESRIESKRFSDMSEAYLFLDHHLGEFYKWYEENLEDTLLIITGDHVSELSLLTYSNKESASINYKMPLIIAGLSDEDKEKYGKYINRIGGLHDIPATVMSLLGQESHNCDLGINLLSTEETWPKDRLVYSISGDSLENLYIWANELYVYFDGFNKTFNYELNDIREDIDIVNIDRIASAYINNIYNTHHYLLENNLYFKTKKIPENPSHDRKIKKTKTLFVSHRGNINGPSGNKNENSRRALENAIESGFEWVEIDIQFTNDGIPILMHDSHLSFEDNSIPVDSLTYNQIINLPDWEEVLTLEEVLKDYLPRINILIEVKPIYEMSRYFHATRTIGNLIKDRDDKNKIIIDSFQEDVAESLKKYCNCQVGYDTPFKEKLTRDEIIRISHLGLDWIYVEQSVVDAALIETAHDAGLKVMAYTINDFSTVEEWMEKKQVPDGIITDYINVFDKYRQQK